MFLRFARRLLRAIPERKLLLIVDGHPAHKAARTARWVQQHGERIELYDLPGYCPELNPDELLNHDTRQAMRQQRPLDQHPMMGNVRAHLRRRQKQPQVVQRFFQQQHVRYAAA